MPTLISHSPQDISTLCNYLSDERREQAVSFLQYLVQQENISRLSQTQNAFVQIDELIENENIWQTEQEMLDELAEFRRKRSK